MMENAITGNGPLVLIQYKSREVAKEEKKFQPMHRTIL